MDTKLTGYLLLALGLILIVIAATQVYFTFTGSNPPLPLVHTSGMSLAVPGLPEAGSGQMQLLSAADLNQITNLTLTYLLYTFLVSVGFRVASLGVQLLRPIEVKLNQKSAPPPVNPA